MRNGSPSHQSEFRVQHAMGTVDMLEKLPNVCAFMEKLTQIDDDEDKDVLPGCYFVCRSNAAVPTTIATTAHSSGKTRTRAYWCQTKAPSFHSRAAERTAQHPTFLLIRTVSSTSLPVCRELKASSMTRLTAVFDIVFARSEWAELLKRDWQSSVVLR